ncbi:PO113 protein, partial [Halcyon senegalensis]|nr:PO113 protein [Halcyon senegalensis]
LAGHCFETSPIRSESPVAGLTVFTDASKNSSRAAITWKEGESWQDHVIPGGLGDSLQTLELRAVVWVFVQWPDTPLNVVSDSLYVVGVVRRIERAVLKELNNHVLSQLFCEL